MRPSASISEQCNLSVPHLISHTLTLIPLSSPWIIVMTWLYSVLRPFGHDFLREPHFICNFHLFPKLTLLLHYFTFSITSYFSVEDYVLFKEKEMLFLYAFDSKYIFVCMLNVVYSC